MTDIDILAVVYEDGSMYITAKAWKPPAPITLLYRNMKDAEARREQEKRSSGGGGFASLGGAAAPSVAVLAVEQDN